MKIPLSILLSFCCAMGAVRGANGGELQNLHLFGPGPLPEGSLIQGADGATYGTTLSGGPDQLGTVLKITATGETVVLHTFIWSPNGVNGGRPTGLTLASDGNFYGATSSGGRNGHGTIFRITPQGSLTTIHHFGSSGNDYHPTTLVEGNDGYLYGTTEGSGGLYAGIAFKISRAGAYTQLHRFSLGTYGGHGLDGGFPGPLMKSQNGNLYGLAQDGGAHGHGSLFRVNPAGGVDRIYSFQDPYYGSRKRLVELNPGEFYVSGGIVYRLTLAGVLTVLHTFADSDIAGFSSENLVAGGDGNLYGTCSTGRPPSDSGIVFRITSSGVFDIIHTFTGGVDGGKPRGGLVRSGEQTFRGTTTEGGLYGRGTTFEVTAQGTFTTLYNFSANNDGTGGSAAMVEVEDGSLYGAMRQGGSFGWGTIFRVTPEGELTTLYNFQGEADRGLPGRLVLGPDGFFYGITHYYGEGYGTLFKVSRTGTFTTIRSFISEEENSMGDLVLGSDGNFYATMGLGGANHIGAIVKVTPAGEITVVHDFVSETDGSEPYCTLVRDGKGFLYGTVSLGGANGSGTIFRCNPAGDFTVLHHFYQEGRPSGDVVLGADGSIYGTTYSGGANFSGTLFRVAPNGVFTVLHDFATELAVYGTSLIHASDGTLYGSSAASGENREGYLFQLTSNGVLNVLHAFTGGADGSQPGAIMLASSGILYGSTIERGGAFSLGTLFSYSVRPAAALLNISTRMRVETGDNVLIGGFIVAGSAPKNVAIRGIGPSLSSVGISGALADPTLELRGSDGALISSNDNWQDYPLQAAQLTALGFGLPHPNEAGLIATLPPNAYTAVLAGKKSGTGVGLVEVYDIDQTANAQMANISTRGLVQTGTNVMIGGFILGGPSADTHVIVRGIGPSLADLGLNPVLADPTLELHDGNGALLVSNDNWLDDSTQAIELTASGLAPTHWQEAGIRALLPPGPFTAVLAGQNGGSGIGLIEIYNLN